MINWHKIGPALEPGLPLRRYVDLLQWAGVGVRLYAGAPGRWIAEGLDGKLYEFPGVEGGWEQRRPHAGEPAEDRLVDPLNAAGTGWPVVDREALLRARPS